MSNDNQIAVVNHLFDQILELRAENKTLKEIIAAGTNTVLITDNQIAFDNILSELEILLLRRNEQDENDALEADARLGRMVRNMPIRSVLMRSTYGGYNLEVDDRGNFGYYTDPETAFEAAGIADGQYSDK